MAVSAAQAESRTSPRTTQKEGPARRRARHRGLFTIPPTPFSAEGALDVDSLRRVISFCVETGAQGIVSPVNVSEFTTLTRDERQVVFETIAREIDRTGSAVPFVAGVGALTTQEAVAYAHLAQDAGADAVIAMPAFGAELDDEGCFDFYAALGRATPLPIYIQNHEPVGMGPGPRPGRALSAALMARIIHEVPTVRYVKEESVGTGEKMTRTLELAGDECWGVMGGKAGRFLLDEYRRGACGTMPACEVNDVHAQLWQTLDGGCEVGARLLLREMLPLLDFEESYGPVVIKEVLYRRGLISSPFRRAAGPTLDRYDHAELDDLLAAVAPYFKVKTPIARPG